jgi:hypothetical protein
LQQRPSGTPLLSQIVHFGSGLLTARDLRDHAGMQQSRTPARSVQTSLPTHQPPNHHPRLPRGVPVAARLLSTDRLVSGLGRGRDL